MADAGRSIGMVKWFSGQKGFDFVSPDDGDEDLFVHQTEIRIEGYRTLQEGQRVEFRVDSRKDRRNKAVEVIITTGSYDFVGRRGGGGGRGSGYGRGGGGRVGACIGGYGVGVTEWSVIIAGGLATWLGSVIAAVVLVIIGMTRLTVRRILSISPQFSPNT